MQWTGAFSTVRHSDALFPSDFGEDLLYRVRTDPGKSWKKA